MRDLVSVIIPTYNRANYCLNAVASVLAQTHSNLEAIVVDDGSTDGTRDVLRGLDDRVLYLWQPNAGVSAARNRGLKQAKGDYIAFLDSDDEWLPWKLEAQLSVLKAFPEAGMTWTDFQAVSAEGALVQESYLRSMYSAYDGFDCETCFRTRARLSDFWKGCPPAYREKMFYVGYIFSWMLLGNLVHTSTVLMRRERQRQVGCFDTDLIRSGEDYDYHFRTCRLGDVALIDLPSIKYRVGSADQLTASRHMLWMARNNLKTVKKMLALARNEIDLPSAVIRKRLAHSCAWIGREEFERGDRNARKHFKESLKMFPFQKRTAAYLLLSYLPPAATVMLRAGRQKMKKSLLHLLKEGEHPHSS